MKAVVFDKDKQLNGTKEKKSNKLINLFFEYKHE